MEQSSNISYIERTFEYRTHEYKLYRTIEVNKSIPQNEVNGSVNTSNRQIFI